MIVTPQNFPAGFLSIITAQMYKKTWGKILASNPLKREGKRISEQESKA